MWETNHELLRMCAHVNEFFPDKAPWAAGAEVLSGPVE